MGLFRRTNKFKSKEDMALTTKKREERKTRNATIKAQYEILIKDPSNMKMAIANELMKLHDVTLSMYYRAIK